METSWTYHPSLIRPLLALEEHRIPRAALLALFRVGVWELCKYQIRQQNVQNMNT